jgi:hypothetical protein
MNSHCLLVLLAAQIDNLGRTIETHDSDFGVRRQKNRRHTQA